MTGRCMNQCGCGAHTYASECPKCGAELESCAAEPSDGTCGICGSVGCTCAERVRYERSAEQSRAAKRRRARRAVA